MPFVIYDQVGASLSLLQILPCNLHFQPFCANLRSCNLECQKDLTKNPIFAEAESRIRRFHEFSWEENRSIDHQAKLAALADAAPKDSTTQLLLDILMLWDRKAAKLKALSEIMGSCANEIDSKAMLSPSKTPNPHIADTPYTLVSTMTIH
jgi:hypothetical protein